MKAMIITKICDLSKEKEPLKTTTIPQPVPGDQDILIRVTCCGVCHTELDIIEGRTPPARYPVIPGHQVVGYVEKKGIQASRFEIGDRVGVAWIHHSCGSCSFCLSGKENLCPHFIATGRDTHGGYAEYMTVNQHYAHKLPLQFSDAEAAPLLCAGAIGYRSMKLSGLEDGQTLGLTGFGASAHLVLKMVKHQYPSSKVYVFARSKTEQLFARELGAEWAGDTTETAPGKLNAIIDTTPAWKPVVEALRQLEKGGRLVINAIRKEISDKDHLLDIHYPSHLWWEKEIKSIANVTRDDVSQFLELAAEIPVKPDFREYPLENANQALLEIKEKKIRGAKVLRI